MQALRTHTYWIHELIAMMTVQPWITVIQANLAHFVC